MNLPRRREINSQVDCEHFIGPLHHPTYPKVLLEMGVLLVPWANRVAEGREEGGNVSPGQTKNCAWLGNRLHQVSHRSKCPENSITGSQKQKACDPCENWGMFLELDSKVLVLLRPILAHSH